MRILVGAGWQRRTNFERSWQNESRTYRQSVEDHLFTAGGKVCGAAPRIASRAKTSTCPRKRVEPIARRSSLVADKNARKPRVHAGATGSARRNARIADDIARLTGGTV